MNKYNIDIEYGHIYMDRKNEDVPKSISIAKRLITLHTGTLRKSVLIDDYNKKPIFNILEYLEYLQKELEPDRYQKESDLCVHADEIINLLPNLKTEYFRKESKTVLFFDDGNNKIALKQTIEQTVNYTCAILTLTWYILRLKSSERLFNILNKEFQDNEENVRILLSNTKYKDFLDQIKNIYY